MGWQPIETAPRDRRILVATDENQYVGQWVKNPFNDDEAFSIYRLDDGSDAIVRPKLWRDLDAHPVQS